MKTLSALGLALISGLFASEVRAQDIASLAQLTIWEATALQYYAELEAYQGTSAQGEAENLRRSANFYPLHRRALLDSSAMVRGTQHVAEEDMAYLRRGMALLAEKHAEVRRLLDALKNATSDRASNALKGEILPYYHMRLFSPINGTGRVPTESFTAERLPKSGVIEPKQKEGRPMWEHEMDKEQTAEALASDCSCRTVSLARVTVKQLKPGHEVGDKEPRLVTTVYDIWDDSNAPHTGPLTIPVLKYGEDLCLYFTYPEANAYLVLEGRPKLCDVKVELKFPWARSRTGEQRTVRQLYSVTGVGGEGLEGRKIITNELVMRVWPEYNTMGPAGKQGHILWSFRRPSNMKGGFDRQICKKISFTVQ